MDTAELQEEILGALYEETAVSPFTHFTTDSLIDDVVETIDEDIEDNEIEYAIRRLDEDHLVEYDPALNSRGSIKITPHGVESYNTEHKTFLKTENWYEILQFLQELDEENPGAFWKGESLREDLDMDNTAADRNIWYLKERGFIDVSMVMGDPPYSSVQITQTGRQALETQDEVLQQQASTMSRDETDQYDVFISHASEDKDDFVRPLAENLSSEGVNVRYDEFELELGDSLRDSIDKGLANSVYGIIVLSEAYFEKDWAQYELDGLVARDIGDEKVILPIWYRISKDEIMNNSPTLADRYALRTDGDNIIEVVEELLAIID